MASRIGNDPAVYGDLPLLEQDARALIDAAIRLTEAETPVALGDALVHDLALWVAIETMAGKEESGIDRELRGNLSRLAAFVIRTILEVRDGVLSEHTFSTLAGINLHIADGLLRSQQNHLVRERAYELWQEEGCPDDRQQEHWLRAEREIAALLRTGVSSE